MPLPDINAQRSQFYQKRREDIGRQANANAQSQNDALTRRFTQIGQANSGAAIAAQMKANDAAEVQKNTAMNELGAQESGELMQIGEAQKGRDFQAGQNALQMGFQDRQLGQQQKQFDTDQGNKLAQIDLAKKQFELDKDTTEFNKRMAEIEAGKKAPGMLDGLGLDQIGLGGSPAGIVKKFIMPDLPKLPGFGGGGGLFSDENLKKNIKDGSGSVEQFLESIKPFDYEYKNVEHGSGTFTGVMAQDLEKTPAGAKAVVDTPEGKVVHFERLISTMLASQAQLHQRIKLLEERQGA